VLLLTLSLLIYYHDRVTIDDAQVDGHIVPIASKIYGTVAEVLVDDNQPVKAGQVLVRIDPRDYQAKLAQAKAALAMVGGASQMLTQHGSDPVQAANQAHALLYGLVQRQAAMQAFIDCFWLMGAIFLCIIPLMFLMKKMKPHATPTTAH